MDFESETLIAHTLTGGGFDASEDGSGRGTPIVPIQSAQRGKDQNGLGIGGDGDPMFTLDQGSQHAIASGWAVRRLTPLECERLQGFPDGWTDVPYRGKRAADGPRYKALGNSMAVNCMAWIGARLDLCERLTRTAA
jgi:DNA (cytosine-5)-methyltransferase 1